MAKNSSMTVLDGHETIGGTKILVESGETQLLLDFGTNYHQWGKFYDEFTQPRGPRGIVDFLATELVPSRKGWYRPDLFAPRDLQDPKLKDLSTGSAPDAVLLSHAHLDHCGAISILRHDIPVLCTPMTFALLRAMQETGGQGVSREIAFTLEKAPSHSAPEPGCSDPTALLESQGVNHPRRFQLFGGLTGPLASFAQDPPFPSNDWEASSALPTPAPMKVRDVHVEHFPVDHSLYGAAAFTLDLDGSRVAYTGDLRLAGVGASLTRRFVIALAEKAPDVLLVEGTRLRGEKDGPQEEVTEAQVEATASRLVEKSAGKFVVADFGPRNIERLLTFLRVARKSGRTLVITPKDAFVLWAMAQADPKAIPIEALRKNEMRILEEPTQSTRGRWPKVVWGSWKKPSDQEKKSAMNLGLDSPSPTWANGEFAGAAISAADLAQREGDRGKYLLCFSLYDCNDLVGLRKVTRGGLWLYSSSEAHSEEQEVDFVRLQNWIDWAGLKAVGFSLVPNARGGLSPIFESTSEGPLHASGHAREEELVDLIRASRAKKVVPVHTEIPGAYRKLFDERKVDAKLVLPSECKNRMIQL